MFTKGNRIELRQQEQRRIGSKEYIILKSHPNINFIVFGRSKGQIKLTKKKGILSNAAHTNIWVYVSKREYNKRSVDRDRLWGLSVG